MGFIIFSLVKKDKVYIVEFDSSGGSEISSIEVVEKSSISILEIPVKEGYEFLGWYLNDSLFYADTIIKEDIKLVAKWQNISDKKTYKVIFDYQNNKETKELMVLENEKIEKPLVPTYDGYVFKGWYVGDVLYNFNSLVTSDLLLVAKWEDEDGNEVAIKEYYCEKGYTLEATKCIKVIDEYAVTTTRYCENNDILNDGKCLGYADYVEKCRDDTLLKDGKCFGVYSNDLEEDVCYNELESDAYYDSESKVCYKRVPKEKECPVGYNLEEDKCIKESNALSKKECKAGYKLKKDMCVKEKVLNASVR